MIFLLKYIGNDFYNKNALANDQNTRIDSMDYFPD